MSEPESPDDYELNMYVLRNHGFSAFRDRFKAGRVTREIEDRITHEYVRQLERNRGDAAFLSLVLAAATCILLFAAFGGFR